MLAIMQSARILGLSIQTLKVPPHHSTVIERRVNDFSKAIIEETMRDDPISFEEYKKNRCRSLEAYIRWAQPAFPEKTDQMFKKIYDNNCESAYRSYKKSYENPSNNIAFMLQKDFFEDNPK